MTVQLLTHAAGTATYYLLINNTAKKLVRQRRSTPLASWHATNEGITVDIVSLVSVL